jgi:hypothetical protein
MPPVYLTGGAGTHIDKNNYFRSFFPFILLLVLISYFILVVHLDTLSYELLQDTQGTPD